MAVARAVAIHRPQRSLQDVHDQKVLDLDMMSMFILS